MGKVIGVTGPRGFIAGYLLRRLENDQAVQTLVADRELFAAADKLDSFVSQCDVICHIAGVNRGDERTIYDGNITLAQQLVAALKRTSARAHVLFASSTQRDQDNAYGRAKKAAEECLLAAGEEHGFPVTVCVIPNVYGPGCKPFYNSVVATFCHQLARGKTPSLIDDKEVRFLHVNDVVDKFIEAFDRRPSEVTVTMLEPTAVIKVSQLLTTLQGFQHSFFGDGIVPDQADPLTAGLYSTFLSYVDLEDHRHRPVVRQDERGSLFEIIKLAHGGQVFFSTTKPGVIRGDHYHTRKFEWFCVLRGKAVIRLRHVQSQEIREFAVSGDQPEFISIPALYTHHIENVGDEELLTMFWCNEIFSADDPDTFYKKVA